MHTVGAEALRQAHAVVDDKGDVRIGAEPLQRLRKACELMFVHILDPQLERRGDPRLERGLEPVRKGTADLLRADQVQLRGIGPLAWRESDRIEVDVVQGQAGIVVTDAS